MSIHLYEKIKLMQALSRAKKKKDQDRKKNLDQVKEALKLKRKQ